MEPSGEFNKELYNETTTIKRLSTESLLELLKDSLVKITNLHFSKHKYALAKANAEDKPKLNSIDQRNGSTIS